jgi:hypothetical protein
MISKHRDGFFSENVWAFENIKTAVGHAPDLTAIRKVQSYYSVAACNMCRL